MTTRTPTDFWPSFAELKIGTRFRWVVAPERNGELLTGVFLKAGEQSFGSSAGPLPWLASADEVEWPCEEAA